MTCRKRRNDLETAGVSLTRDELRRRDGKELFYLGFDGRVQAVPVRLSPKPHLGAATALFAISNEASAAFHSLVGFDASADGQRFVIPVVSSLKASSIVVVQNWGALLPRKR